MSAFVPWVTLWLAASPTGLPVGNEGPLRLEEVVGSALRAYPSVVAALEEQQVAEGEALAARGAFDPVLKSRAIGVPPTLGPYSQLRVDTTVEVPTPLWGTSLFAGHRLGVGDIPDYYGERRTWSAGELRAGAVVPLLRNGPIDRRRATIERAAFGARAAAEGAGQLRLEVVRQATTRYWEWVAAGQRLSLARELLAVAEARDGQLDERVRRGDAAIFDRDDNRRSIVQRRAVVVSARRALEQTALELSLFLRDDAGAPMMPAEAALPAGLGDASTPAAPPSLDEVRARRPDLRRVEALVEQARVERRWAANQWLPALDVGVAVTKDVGAPLRGADVKLGQTELELSVALEVPLRFRAIEGRDDAARAALSRLEAQRRLALDRAAVEVRDTWSAVRAAGERATLAQAEARLASELEAGERRRFELGESSLLFVNLREQARFEAALRGVDATLEHHRAVAALALATGEPPAAFER